MTDRLNPGQELHTGEQLTSNNGKTRLVMQDDGNLVLYRTDSGRALWASGTYRRPVVRAVMQGDGNLVCYDASNRAYWAAGTYRYPGSYVVLQDDGNLVVYNTANSAVWASNTPENWNAGRYHLRVATADEASAGTDSNIFLILYGEYGQTSEKRLNGYIHGNAFERGNTDTFDIFDWETVGRIYKIRVRSDTHYAASDWRLSRIDVVPLEPPFPSSTFRYENWINDTEPREITAEDWPWPVKYEGTQVSSKISRTVTAIDLLDAGELQQEYTVTYSLEDQVEVSTDVTDTSKLTTDVKWQSPESEFIGQLTVDVKAEWEEAIKNHRLEKTTRGLKTEDKRTVTFPAGKLSMVEADWAELWSKALASLGSTSVGIQWLESIPVNPSWTIKNFSCGDTIPEPFASYIRDHHPELVPYFKLAPPLPREGAWYSIAAKQSNKCLDIAGAGLGNGSRAIQWEWCGGDNQRWQFVTIEPGVYMIRVRHSGKCLDVGGPGDHTATGAGVQQWDWCDGSNQKWRLIPQADGSYSIMAIHSGKVLDVGGDHTGNGAPVNQWDWWGGDNQKWFLAEC